MRVESFSKSGKALAGVFDPEATDQRIYAKRWKLLTGGR